MLPKIEKGDDLQIWRNKVNAVHDILKPLNEFQSDFESNEVNTVMDSKYFHELIDANNIKQEQFTGIIFNSIDHVTKKKFKQIASDTLIFSIILGE